MFVLEPAGGSNTTSYLDGLENPSAANDCARLSLGSYTDLPICVGFGIKSPEDAKSISLSADGVVVGSAIIETVQKGASESEVSDFISSLSKSVHSN